MGRSFTLAAVLACTLTHLQDPKTKHDGWLIKCYSDDKGRYIGAFPKHKRSAINTARHWIEAHRPKLKVSVAELRAGN